VLVGAADIRRYDLENDAVIDRLSCRIAEGRKVDVLDFDAAGLEVNHAAIGVGRHLQSPLGLTLCVMSTRSVPLLEQALSARANSSNHSGSMEDLEDDFGRLAAITPNLALILCGIFLASILHRITPGSRRLGLVAVRAPRPLRGFARKLRETRETQSIVTAESQFSVSGTDSISCSSSRPPY
jgi:hypothetical protein